MSLRLVGNAAGEGTDAADRVGGEIRNLRKAKGLTLSELASKLGRSIGFLSQVERGISSVSVPELREIASALGVTLSWFFVHESAPPEERGIIVRGEHRRALGGSEGGLTEELLSPDLSGDFEVVLSTFEPGASLGAPTVRPTEEFGYLIAGRLELEIAGRRFQLKPGDSFRIKREPFEWRNPGKERAVVVWVISPPIY